MKARGDKHKLTYNSISKHTFDMVDFDDRGGGMKTYNLAKLLDVIKSYGFKVSDLYMDDNDLVYGDKTIGKWKKTNYWELIKLLQKKKLVRRGW